MRIATERQLLLIVLIVALIAVMTILKPTTFPRAENAAVVLLDTAQTGILACGMMVLMISGMFDLSIGGNLAFSGIMAGLAARTWACLPSSRSSSAADGACAGCDQRPPRHPLQDQRAHRHARDLVDLSRRTATRLGRRCHQYRQRLHRLRPDADLGIYSPFWFMAVIVLLFIFLVGRTRYFRQAYYIGGNAGGAKLSGINVDRTVFSFFVIMGLLSGLAGALSLAPQYGGGSGGPRRRAQGHHRGGAGRREPRRRRWHHRRGFPRGASHGASAERHDHRRDQPFWQSSLLVSYCSSASGSTSLHVSAAGPERIGETNRKKALHRRAQGRAQEEEIMRQAAFYSFALGALVAMAAPPLPERPRP